MSNHTDREGDRDHDLTEPGGNYADGVGHPNADGRGPDQGGEWSGPVSGDDDSPGLQTRPLQDVHNSDIAERIEGLVVQTRGDIVVQEITDRPTVERLLVQRLQDTGLSVDADEVERLVDRVLAWEDSSRIEPGAVSRD